MHSCCCVTTLLICGWCVCLPQRTLHPLSDRRRALNTLRYIHANPKTASMQAGFFYDFSNYGTYDRLTADGLTEWHPAFLSLGVTLVTCAAVYRAFCQKYRPRPKPEKQRHWGKNVLAGITLKKKPRKTSPGQTRLPWDEWQAPFDEIHQIARQFVWANALNPEIASIQFDMGFMNV